MDQKKKNIIPHSVFLFKEGKLSYYILGRDQRDAALACIARAMMKEPSTQSVKKRTYVDWLEFCDIWMDECASNGLSVFAMDEREHRMGGVLLVRDFQLVPKKFVDTYSQESKALFPMVDFLLKLDSKAVAMFPPLKENGLGFAADLWLLGVHPDYKGNKIANILIQCVLPLIVKAGYKYATIEAASYFTSKVAEYHGFTALCSENAKEMLFKGKKIFEKMKSPHGEWIYWVKNLQQENTKQFDTRVKKEMLTNSKL